MHNIILRNSNVQGVDNVWETSCIAPTQIINTIFKSSSLFSVDCYSNIVRYTNPFVLNDVLKVGNQSKDNMDWIIIDNPEGKKVSELLPKDISNIKKLFADSSISLRTSFPSVGNKFNFYTHDMGFYSCFFVSNLSVEYVCHGLLNQIVQSKRKDTVKSVSSHDTNISLLVEKLKGGIAIDVDSIIENGNEISFLYHHFCDETSKFGDFLYPRQPIVCQQRMSIIR